ncbi:unnamed protein product [Symbiodinium sp. CCMP2592]|nr:unnamed protein product [Symbiodinium sp. CCMP2592]
MGGWGEAKKGGGKGRGKGQVKGKGKGEGKGKGRAWMQGDPSPPRADEDEGHLGPLQLPGDGSGTLTAEDRQEIKDATGVSAAVRYRNSFGMRMLTLAGPPDHLSEARRMAMAKISASQVKQAEADQVADLAQRLGAAELKLSALQHQVSYLVSSSPAMQMYAVGAVAAPGPPAQHHGHHHSRRGSRHSRSSSSSRRAARHRKRRSSSRSRGRLSSTSPADAPSPAAGDQKVERSAEARPADDEAPPGLPLKEVKREEPAEALEETKAEEPKSADESSSSSPDTATPKPAAAKTAPSRPAPFPTGLGQGGLKRENSPEASKPAEPSEGPPASLPAAEKKTEQQEENPEQAATPPAKRCKEELPTEKPRCNLEKELPLMRPLQKPRARLHKLEATVSFAAAARLEARHAEEGQDESHRTKRRRQRKDMEEACAANEGTLHGPVLLSFDMPQPDKSGKGAPATVYAANPLALLCRLTAERPEFGDLLKGLTQSSEVPSLVFYADGATPGNVLRVGDASREQMCVYWSILQLPGFVRSQDCGWWHVLSCPTKQLDKTPGGLSWLYAKVLEMFFGTTELPVTGNFLEGVHCTCSEGSFVFRARMGPLLADEKAIKEVWCLKGASGSKPCFQCQNLVGHCSPEEVPPNGWLVHTSCCQPSKFVAHTEATFQAMVSRVQSAATAGERKKLGQVFGLTYTPAGILWQARWLGRINPIAHTCWDWMHILVASGGVGQYHLNGYCCALVAEGIPLKTLDDFARAWVWPRSQHRLPPNFFSQRVNSATHWQEIESHMRAFAGEMLTSVRCVHGFQVEVLASTGILPQHQRCLEVLARILEILRLGDRAKLHLSELTLCIAEHAEICREIYPYAAKPKFHYLFHVPDCIRRFGNLNCFATERKHKKVKALAARYAVEAHAAHDNLCLRTLAEDLRSMEQAALDPVSLAGPVMEAPAQDLAYVAPFVPDAVALRSSTEMPGRI